MRRRVDAVCCAGDDGRRTRARADGRALLAGAIANTRGSYLVYNFGDGHPAPMLNAGGGWYEMNNGGHLMTIKSAAGRLQPRIVGRQPSGLPGAVRA